MSRSIVGTRIRERRRATGLTQAELARRVGISASYLNLIERNKRGIAGKLLGKVAEELGLRLSELDGAAERRLLSQLELITSDPRLAGLQIERDAAGEFIGRYPGWARALGALARSEKESAERAEAFAGRLTHDPFLGETVHRMLTRIAAIRSTAEILDAVPDIESEQAQRFHAILSTESQTLTEVAEALAAYFDKATTDARRVTPSDEVEALFQDNANRFSAIEAAVAGAEAPSTETGLHATVELRAGPVIDRLILEAPEIETARARARAREALLRYAMDALLAPAETFAEMARSLRYDIEALSAKAKLPPDLVCRRLTTLPPREGQPRIGYAAANGAGTIIELRELPGFHPMRHGSICPLWVLCRAAQYPERAVRQLASFPNGQRFVFVARARVSMPAGFGRPSHITTDMLVFPEEDAGLTVYGAGMAGIGSGALEPEEVGTTCRICPRKGCRHRVDDPLAD